MYTTYAESSHYGNPYSQQQQPSNTTGGQISVMTWNPPSYNRNSMQYSQNQTHHHHHSSYNVPTMSSQQRAHPLPMIPMQRSAMSPPQQQQRLVMSPPQQQQQQQHASQSQNQNNSNSNHSQQQQQPKLTTSYWEDEGTICYQVDARGFCVARRQGKRSD